MAEREHREIRPIHANPAALAGLGNSGPLEHEGRYDKHLVIGGDRGSFFTFVTMT